MSTLKTKLKKLDMGGPAPRCPLCHGWMVKKWESERGFFIFACDTDMVALWVGDPFVNKWDEVLHNMGDAAPKCPMPGCETKMRFFATATGFMKAKCPRAKCGATLAGSEPDRDKKVEGPLYTPEKPGTLH